ncbi:MAG: SRPBCC family protein [Alphaproteobacteria bacterium]|nr:SRPBCC family protein [Alphaproteobacteria bacterium]
MNEFATLLEPGTVRLERMLPASIDTVWLYLTDSEKRGTWLGRGEMELHLGGKVEHLFDHATLSATPEDVPEKYKKYDCTTELLGTITAIDPPRLLAYTWNEGEAPDSEVMFELEPKGDMTLLTITHRKLPNRETIIGVSAGWHVHVGIMIQVLEGKNPPPFWGAFMPMEAEYEKRLP